MMIPDGYNINISKRTDKYPNGEHYGRLEMEGVAFLEDAIDRMQELRKIFPEEYKLTLQHVTCRGETLVVS